MPGEPREMTREEIENDADFLGALSFAVDEYNSKSNSNWR